MSCSKCNDEIPTGEDWPDGADGRQCLMCWEEETAAAWWEAVSVAETMTREDGR